MDVTLEKWRAHILDFDYATKLAKPEFIKIDEMVLFMGHFTLESYNENWKPFIQKTPFDKLWKLENTFNHVHLSDVVESLEMQKEIGEYIQAQWRGKLQEQFPDKVFDCEVKLSNNEWEVMLWTKR